uniref:Uncharacterized protein n=1 Tax=Anopheles coluzzii TaxID=1518534 RepID=A0A8W7PQ21_ANOCL
MIRWPHAAQHQYLGRVECPGRQYDLFAREHVLPLLVTHELDTVRTVLIVEQDARDVRVHGNVKVLAQPHRAQEGFGGAAPTAAPYRRLQQHEARLFRPVNVPVFVAHLLAGRHEGDRQWRPPRCLLHGQIPANAMVRGARHVRVPVVLRLDEVRQHVFVAPADVALLLPLVVVEPVAPHIHHRIQHGGAAHDLAARPVAPVADHCLAVAPVSRRRRLVLPIVLGQLQDLMYRCSLRYLVCRSTLLYEEAADADEADDVVEAVDGERDGTADEVVEEVDELVW